MSHLRVTGLASGFDTEAMVEELMTAQRQKSVKVENTKTKLEWKQEKWDELNTKLYSFYTDSVSKMRLQNTYSTKKVSSSNENAVEVTASSNATLGTQQVKVNSIATAQNWTGGQLFKEKVVENSDGTKTITNAKNNDDGTTLITEKTINLDGSYKLKSTTMGLDGTRSTTVQEFYSNDTAKGNAVSSSAHLNANYNSIKTSEKLTESLGISVGTKFNIKVGDKNTEFTVDNDTTIANFVDTLKKAGLSANFDTATNRFFISSKETGTENAFSIDVEETLGFNSSTDISSLAKLGLTSDTGMALTDAKDCIIEYNGATIVNSTNSIKINDLTITAKSVTSSPVNLTVENDTDTIYNSIKDFVTSYNEILKEMNESYNAKSAKGYEPLSNDEKAALSDEEVEKYENKIKDSLLRRDSSLNDIISIMKNAMSTSVTVDGKKYSLTSFGIHMGDYTEKGLYHIDGDEDDKDYADKQNKLKSALQEDPDTVMKVLSEVSKKLYSSMTNKMKTSTLSSAMTFYNDKELKNQIKDYEDKLDDLEDKYATMEDRYYKQFSAMEKALASINSSTNSLASMFGS